MNKIITALIVVGVLLAAGNLVMAANHPGQDISPATADGESLYQLHCSGCHGPLDKTRIPNRRASRIASAINTLGPMASLKSLSQQDIEAIARTLDVL